jgi:hypothetical protein
MGDAVCASQKIHIRASMACYGDSFTLLYGDDVCATHETHTGPHGQFTRIDFIFIICMLEVKTQKKVKHRQMNQLTTVYVKQNLAESQSRFLLLV